jgi:hypothetical protein
MDMRFYWIRDRVHQGQFIVHWRRGTEQFSRLLHQTSLPCAPPNHACSLPSSHHHLQTLLLPHICLARVC